MGRNNHALGSGIFIVVLLVVTITIIYWLGHLERERDVYVVSTQASVSGLNPESTVFFRGIAVGKVLAIGFDPKNSDTILIDIEVDKNIVFTKGISATLHLKGVTGLTQLELTDSGHVPEKIASGRNTGYRIPLLPSVSDRLLSSGDELLKKADHLMVRLTSLLNEENEKNMVGILANLKVLSDKLANLQHGVDKALNEIPVLTSDARKTLKHYDQLAGDLQGLSKEVKLFSAKVSKVADSGSQAGNILVQTTLPKINKLLSELTTTTEQVKRMATNIENDPKSVLLGPDQQVPGPGEPGFEEPK